MNTFHYREMTSRDYDQMIELWKRTPGIGLSDADSKENIGTFLKRNPELSFVCVSDQRIVGTILCGHDGRRGYLYHLVVDEDERKQGIGKELVARSLEQLRRQGIAKCHLFVYNDNSVAIEFYEHSGWQRRTTLAIYSKDV